MGPEVYGGEVGRVVRRRSASGGGWRSMVLGSGRGLEKRGK